MKKLTKTLVVICCMLMATATCLAGPIKEISGKKEYKNILKESAVAVLKCDWTAATYDGKQPVAEYFAADWDKVRTDCERSFINGFNDKSSALKLASTSSDAKYTFTLKVDKVDCFFAAMAFVPRHEAKMWGQLDVTDNTTGSVVASFKINEAEDGRDMVRNESFGKTFLEIGKKFAKP